jgi:hypothetical protein
MNPTLNDIVSMFQNAKGTFAIVFLVLWLSCEVMGSIPWIKANNYYGLFCALLATLKDQFTPQKVATTTAATATPSAAAPAQSTPSTT